MTWNCYKRIVGRILLDKKRDAKKTSLMATKVYGTVIYIRVSSENYEITKLVINLECRNVGHVTIQ